MEEGKDRGCSWGEHDLCGWQAALLRGGEGGTRLDGDLAGAAGVLSGFTDRAVVALPGGHLAAGGALRAPGSRSSARQTELRLARARFLLDAGVDVVGECVGPGGGVIVFTQRRNRRLDPYRGVRVGEAAHPGPPSPGAPAKPPKPPDHFSTLGVEREATGPALKQAYKRLALARHPDKVGGSKKAFQALQTAYDTLSDPGKRAAYEREVARWEAQDAKERAGAKGKAKGAARAAAAASATSSAASGVGGLASARGAAAGAGVGGPASGRRRGGGPAKGRGKGTHQAPGTSSRAGAATPNAPGSAASPPPPGGGYLWGRAAEAAAAAAGARPANSHTTSSSSSSSSSASLLVYR